MYIVDRRQKTIGIVFGESTAMLSKKIKQYDFRPDVLAGQVSKILTEAILEDVLKGGDKLVESELQKQFGISRSPLREAFRDLEKKGLVTIAPRKGTFVKRIARKDIQQNFPVRATLESLAAKEAFKKMDVKDRSRMQQVLLKMDQAVKANDPKSYWKQHIVFHEIFITACGNDVLVHILHTLRMHSLWYRFSYKYYREDLPGSLAVHRKILNLFNDSQTDPAALAALVQDHIETAAEKFLVYLEEP